MFFRHNPFYSVIVLSDTQLYASKYPEIFSAQLDWILKEKEKLNIRFVSHLGDIVDDNSADQTQWHKMAAELSKLDGVIPYALAPGNHDADFYDDEQVSFQTYNHFFPIKKFRKQSWYGGGYLGNQNSYQHIVVDTFSLLFIHLQIDPSDKILQWADNILKRHRDTMAVIATHAFVYDDLPYRSDISHYGGLGNAGEDIWHKLIKTNCNIRLVLSGHFHTQTGENYIMSANTCGEAVHQAVQNFQDLEKGGNGFLRIFQFFPNKKEIKVSTYSPYIKKFKRGRKSNFMIRY
ncbi:metallophosphoesterase [Candidatus Roizmanbacteria bacterium]|nr:MAG: metallophosphoesterase [Candidatus Roizmanbacteria bacterium]